MSEEKTPLPVEGMHHPNVYYPMMQQNGAFNGRTVAGYRKTQSRVLGVFLILVGIACIAFNGVSIAHNDVMPANYVYTIVGYGCIGHGIWSGTLFILAGILGLVASCKQTKCTIISFMVLCIISAAATAVLLALGILGAVTAERYPQWFERHGPGCQSSFYDYAYYVYVNGYYDWYYPIPPPCKVFKVVIAMESCMAIMALFAAIFSIWGSVLGCKALCCCSAAGQTHEMTMKCACQHQQMPYYVWPSPGNEGLPGFAPPVYSPQVTGCPAEEPKSASQC